MRQVRFGTVAVCLAAGAVAMGSILATAVSADAHAAVRGAASGRERVAITNYDFSCSPSAGVGKVTTCVAASSSPKYASATGTITFRSATGRFSPRVCTVRSGSFGRGCSVNYTPTGSGAPRTDTVSAAYSGDKRFLPLSGSTTVQVGAPRAQVVVEINCGTGYAEQATPCEVFVDASQSGGPGVTGTLHLSADSGSVTPVDCALTVMSSGSECDFTWTPATTGFATITAAYSGDTSYAPTTSDLSVDADNPRVPVDFACPSTVHPNVPVTCTVTLSSVGNRPPPSGELTFQLEYGHFFSSDGTFTPSTCTPVSHGNTSSCSVQYVTPGANSTEYLGVSAAADANYSSAYGQTSLTVVTP